MMATGARVRLIRRGAVRPVGVRWAAPIACARSVQAVARRQRCHRHRCNQVSSKARKQAPEQHRRGAPAHRARHPLGNHTPTHVHQHSPHRESSSGVAVQRLVDPNIPPNPMGAATRTREAAASCRIYAPVYRPTIYIPIYTKHWSLSDVT